MTEGWLQVADARDDYEAQLIIGRLTEAGIESNTLKSGSAPGAWLTGVQNQWGPVAVLVPPEEFQTARRVLEGFGAEGYGVEGEADEAETTLPSTSSAVLVVIAIVVAGAMIAAFLYSTRLL